MDYFKRNEKISVSDILIMIFSVLPQKISAEITALCRARRDFPLGLSEIRLRAEGRSSVVLSGENIPLFSRVTAVDLEECYDRALGGALYAHADEIKRGFFSMPYGVRVGISASKRGGELLPLAPSGLAFRLPSAPSENADKIFSLWQEKRPRGMLIYSRPGCGKTSALRALSGFIGREGGLSVAVIDERREFACENFSGCSVDVLSGYGKSEGIEIAMRTLSPGVIVVDEIGTLAEAESLIAVGRGGVPIIASAHADSFSELKSRAPIKLLLDNGYFELFVRLKREKGRFFFDYTGADNDARRVT